MKICFEKFCKTCRVKSCRKHVFSEVTLSFLKRHTLFLHNFGRLAEVSLREDTKVKALMQTRRRAGRGRKAVLLLSRMNFLIQAVTELHRQLQHHTARGGSWADEGTTRNLCTSSTINDTTFSSSLSQITRFEFCCSWQHTQSLHAGLLFKRSSHPQFM